MSGAATSATPKYTNQDAAFFALYNFYKEEAPRGVDGEKRVILSYRSDAEVAIRIAGRARTEFADMQNGECRLVLVNGMQGDMTYLDTWGQTFKTFNIQISGVHVLEARTPQGGRISNCFQSLSGSNFVAVVRTPTMTISAESGGGNVGSVSAAAFRIGSQRVADVDVQERTQDNTRRGPQYRSPIARVNDSSDSESDSSDNEAGGASSASSQNVIYVPGVKATELVIGGSNRSNVPNKTPPSSEASNQKVLQNLFELSAARKTTVTGQVFESRYQLPQGNVLKAEKCVFKAPVELTAALRGVCVVILPESVLEGDLIIKDPIRTNPPRDHTVTAYPPSFNFAYGSGEVGDGARGRMNGGVLHQCNGRQYDPVNVLLVIKGGTINGDIIFEDCQGDVSLQDGALIKGTVQNGSILPAV